MVGSGAARRDISQMPAGSPGAVGTGRGSAPPSPARRTARATGAAKGPPARAAGELDPIAIRIDEVVARDVHPQLAARWAREPRLRDDGEELAVAGDLGAYRHWRIELDANAVGVDEREARVTGLAHEERE